MWMKLSGWSNRADQNYYFCGRSTACMITKTSEQGGACVEGVCVCGRVCLWACLEGGADRCVGMEEKRIEYSKFHSTHYAGAFASENGRANLIRKK